MRVTFIETAMAGEPGVLFFLISNEKDRTEFKIFAVETTRDTFRAWGGAARMLQLREVVDGPEAFPATRRKQIAEASLEEQAALYEAVLDKFYQSGITPSWLRRHRPC